MVQIFVVNHTNLLKICLGYFLLINLKQCLAVLLKQLINLVASQANYRSIKEKAARIDFKKLSYDNDILMHLTCNEGRRTLKNKIYK